jgi:tetratricopeptide (TPR) repeat protein
MAEISLKEYLEKANSLFQRAKYDEVVQHTRHILKHFPKNAAVHRLLGQAQVQLSNYPEAEASLRRVLAVHPDDAVAHAHLSEINARLGKAREAIWHMERALEQAPGEKAYVDGLRHLYQQHRGTARLQLSTGAVARQYIRNGLYPQAIETLQATLEKSPNRVDLRLHLAQTMWEAGMQVEAAETALDVLKTLPYCLGANQILTRLWLAEGRPSDAQRYLNQIQEVAPYLALQIAQGSPPPDNAFTVPELDYRRVAESQLATQQPDWLEDVGSDNQEDEALPADFLTQLEADDTSQPSPIGPGSGFTGLLHALDAGEEAEIEAGEVPDWLAAAAPTPEETVETGEEQDIVDLFGDFDDQVEDLVPAGTSDPLDWLRDDDFEDASSEIAPLDEGVPEADEAEQLAWMREAGIDLMDDDSASEADAAAEDFFAFADPNDVDSLAWMENAGVELVDDNSPDASAEAAPPAQSPDDSLEWLQTDSDELPELESLAQNLSADDENLDWLNDDSLLDEFFSLENLTETPADAIPAAPGQPVSPDQTQIEDTMSDHELSPTDPSDDDMSEPLDESSDDHALDWMTELEDDQPDWLNEVPDETSETQAEPGAPDWLESADTTTSSKFGWLESTEDANEIAPLSEDDEIQPTADIPDWLSEAAPEAEAELETAVEQSLDWLESDDDEESVEEDAQPIGDMPDWLSEVAPEAEPEAEPEPEMEAAAETAFGWLESDEESAEEDAQLIGDMPDWLSEVAPETEPEAEPEPEMEAAAETAFGWLESDEESAEEDVQPISDMPDWLSAVAPEAEPEAEAEPEMEAAAETAFDWLESDEESAEEDVQPISDMPDWLSAVAPAAEPEAEAEPEMEAAAETAFDWLESDEDTETSEQDAQPISDMPDWLSEVAPETEPEAEPETAAETAFDWLESDEESAEEDAQPISDMPDWLSEVAPETEPELETAAEEPTGWVEDDADLADTAELAEAATVEGYEWPEEAGMTGSAAELPDWLAEVGPEDMEEAPEEQPIVPAETRILDDYFADEDEEFTDEPEILASEVDLVEAALMADEEDYGEIPEEPEWLAVEPAADEIEDEFGDTEYEKMLAAADAPPPAENAPDWLNAMVPGLDLDYQVSEDDAPLETTFVEEARRRVQPEADEPLAAEPSNIDWLVEIVDEETGQMAPIEDVPAPSPARRFRMTRQPAWLRRPKEKDTDDDFELPDWLQ